MKTNEARIIRMKHTLRTQKLKKKDSNNLGNVDDEVMKLRVVASLLLQFVDNKLAQCFQSYSSKLHQWQHHFVSISHLSFGTLPRIY